MLMRKEDAMRPKPAVEPIIGTEQKAFSTADLTAEDRERIGKIQVPQEAESFNFECS